jgi:hypothetical protein
MSGTSTTVVSGAVSTTIVMWTQYPQDLVNARAGQLEAMTISVRAVLGPETPTAIRRTPSIMDLESPTFVTPLDQSGGSRGVEQTTLAAIAVSAISEHPSVRAAAMGLGSAQSESRHSLTPPTSPERIAMTMNNISNNNGNNVTSMAGLSLTSPPPSGGSSRTRRFEFADLSSPQHSGYSTIGSHSPSLSSSADSSPVGADISTGHSPMSIIGASTGGGSFSNTPSPSSTTHLMTPTTIHEPIRSPVSLHHHPPRYLRSPSHTGGDSRTTTPSPIPARSSAASPSPIDLGHQHPHSGRSFSPVPADNESDAAIPPTSIEPLHIIVTPVTATRRTTRRLSLGSINSGGGVGGSSSAGSLGSPDPVSLRLSMVSPASDDTEAPITPDMLTNSSLQSPTTPRAGSVSGLTSPTGIVTITSTTPSLERSTTPTGTTTISSPSSPVVAISSSSSSSGSQSGRRSVGGMRPSSRQLVSFRRDAPPLLPPPPPSPPLATPTSTASLFSDSKVDVAQITLSSMTNINNNTSATGTTIVQPPISPPSVVAIVATERHPFAPSAASPPVQSRGLSASTSDAGSISTSVTTSS